MTTTVNSLRIEASIVGAEGAIAKLKGIEEAQRKAAAAGEQLADDTKQVDTSFANAAKTAEALRRKYIDGYAAAQTFQAEVTRLNRAIQAGTINSQEAAAVLSALKSRMDAAGASALTAGTRMQTFGTQAANAGRMTTMQMTQMQYQLNDVAMGLATGQSPFIVISQQGAQVAQMFQGSTLRSAISAVGAGFMAMLNPINLTVVGLAAAAAAVSFLWSSWDEGEDKVKTDLEAHEALIKRVTDAYGAAAKAAIELARAEAEGSLKYALSENERSLKLHAGIAERDARGQIAGRSDDDALQAYPEARPFSAAMYAFERGLQTVEQFRESVENIALQPGATEEMKDYAAELLEATQRAGELAAKLREAQAASKATTEVGPFREPVNPDRNPAQFAYPEGVPIPREKPNTLDYDPDATGEKPTKAVDTYGELIKAADQRIAQMQVELTALGMTEDAARQYRIEQELILQAQQKGIALSPAEEESLKAKAAAMSSIQKQTEDLKDSQKSAAEAGKFLGQTLESALMGIVQGGDQAKQAIIRLIAELLKGAVIGEGAFAGVFKKLASGSGGGGGAGAAASVAGRTIDEVANGLPAGAETGAAAALAGGADAQSMAWNFWASKGLTPTQVAGVMGNIGAESGFNPSAKGDGGKAWGLYQHHPDRRAGMGPEFLGNPMMQHQLAWQEMQGPESGVWNRLTSAKTLAESTGAMAGFERPQGWSLGNPEGSHNWTGRMAGAEQALAKFGNTTKVATEGLGTLGQGFAGVGEAFGALAGGKGGGGAGVGGIISAIIGMFGFAKGGVSNSPAIFGEAGPEAAVPLPDGRSIPVKMHGGGTPSNVNIGNTNIMISGNADGNTIDQIDKKVRRAQDDMMKEITRARTNEWRDN